MRALFSPENRWAGAVKGLNTTMNTSLCFTGQTASGLKINLQVPQQPPYNFWSTHLLLFSLFLFPSLLFFPLSLLPPLLSLFVPLPVSLLSPISVFLAPIPIFVPFFFVPVTFFSSISVLLAPISIFVPFFFVLVPFFSGGGKKSWSASSVNRNACGSMSSSCSHVQKEVAKFVSPEALSHFLILKLVSAF